MCSMNRQVRDRGSGMKLTERARKLISEVTHTERSDQLYATRMMLVVERGQPEMKSECCKLQGG